MAPNFKKWVWGMILAFIGFSGLLVTLVHIIRTNPPKLTGAEALVVLGSAALAFLGGILYTAQLDRHAWFAYRWRKLGVGSWESFPYCKELRDAYVSSGWVERTLGELAILASSWKETREARQEELRKVYARMGTPEEQRKLSDTLLRFKNWVNAAATNADFHFKHYFHVWKLFETMGMLPIDSRTGEPWANPEAFRKYVQKTLTAEKAPAAQNIPTPEVMA